MESPQKPIQKHHYKNNKTDREGKLKMEGGRTMIEFTSSGTDVAYYFAKDEIPRPFPDQVRVKFRIPFLKADVILAARTRFCTVCLTDKTTLIFSTGDRLSMLHTEM